METAKLLYTHNHYSDTICFHIQQAIEKYLKGYLYAVGIIPKRTHDLVELITACITLNASFDEFTDQCDKISGYYIESRYPIPYPSEPTKEEAQKAIQTAEAIVKLVKGEIEKRD